MSRGTADPNAPIICRLTPWYYRRMGLLAALFLGTGLYFFYDGRVGYPKENKVAMQKAWFESEIIEGPEGYDAAAKLGEDARQAWVKDAREKGWIISKSLDEPRWKDYAASRGWAENPKYHSEDEIRQQFYWGAAMVVVAVVAGFMVLLNHNKVFTGYADHMVMPNGVSVRYADAYCVDKRKWDNKGLAYVHYREAEGAPSRRVTVDDLKYGGAEKVLNRLLAQFKGELIEKPSVEEEQADETGTSANMDVPHQESPPKA